jgi:hypothetical protein
MSPQARLSKMIKAVKANQLTLNQFAWQQFSLSILAGQ